MTLEEIAEMRYFVRHAKDVEKIDTGTTLTINVEVPISCKCDVFISQEMFKQHFSDLIRRYIEDVCYEKRN